MSHRISLSLALIGSAGFAFNASAAKLLDINFEDYTVGNLEGQAGGVMSDTWIAPSQYGDFRVINNFPSAGSVAFGSKAATLSRYDGNGAAQVTMQGGVAFDTGSSGLKSYFSVDFNRADDSDRGIFWLYRQISGNHSVGFSIESGPTPLLQLYNTESFDTVPTTYPIENGKWHRVEFELVSGSPTGTFDAFIQKEGESGRTQLVNDMAWSSANSYLDAVQYLPQGLADSALLTDNIYVEQGGISFPINRPLTLPTPGQPSWNISGSGDWNVAGNWSSGSVPNAADAVAILGGAISSVQTVYTNVPVTVGSLKLDNANTYVIAGGGSLTIDVSTGQGSVSVVQGTHKINLPIHFADSSVIDVASGASLVIGNPMTLAGGTTVSKNGTGTFTLLSTLNAPSAATLKINGGAVNLAAANNDPDITVDIDPATLDVGADQTLGTVGLDLGGNVLNIGQDLSGNIVPAKMTLNSLVVSGGGSINTVRLLSTQNHLVVNGAIDVGANSQLQKQGPGLLKAASFVIAGGGQVDLASGAIALTSSSTPALRMQLAAGSVTTSTADAVGYATAAELGLTQVGGTDVAGTDIVLKLGYQGDANLDGKVNTLDFNQLAGGFGLSGEWFGGDFNYDGAVTSQDFNLLVGNYGKTFVQPSSPTLGAPRSRAG